MRTFHWFDFDTSIEMRDATVPVKVEATISSGTTGVEIEGVHVYLMEVEPPYYGAKTELILSDKQMDDIRAEILKRCTDTLSGL